jgi:broad specificity phosphatase PhoE
MPSYIHVPFGTIRSLLRVIWHKRGPELSTLWEVPALPERIIFARHGRTADNAVNRLSTSPPGRELDSVGQAQARALARFLSERDIIAIYSSPLLRARQTATAVTYGRQTQLVVLDQLRELSVGAYEGRDDADAYRKLDKVWRAWTEDGDLDVRAGPGGESAREVLRRATSVVIRIAQECPVGTVLVVTHAGVLGLFVPHLCTNLEPNFGYMKWPRNCDLIEVESNTKGYSCISWAGEDLTAK